MRLNTVSDPLTAFNVNSAHNSSLTVPNTRCYGLNLNTTNPQGGRFLNATDVGNIIVENCYLEGTAGMYVYRYTGNGSSNETVRIRYVRALRSLDLLLSHRPQRRAIHSKSLGASRGWTNLLSIPSQRVQWQQFERNPLHCSSGHQHLDAGFHSRHSRHQPVTNTHCLVELYSKAGAGWWMYFDDVELRKQ